MEGDQSILLDGESGDWAYLYLKLGLEKNNGIFPPVPGMKSEQTGSGYLSSLFGSRGVDFVLYYDRGNLRELLPTKSGCTTVSFFSKMGKGFVGGNAVDPRK